MRKLIVTVLSNNPAGGRCSLYTNYAQELASLLGFDIQTIYPDESHKLSAPGLLVDDRPVIPDDGLIIDSNDICKAIEQSDFNINDIAKYEVSWIS